MKSGDRHITLTTASKQMSVGTGLPHISPTPVIDHGEVMLDLNKVSGDIKTTKRLSSDP